MEAEKPDLIYTAKPRARGIESRKSKVGLFKSGNNNSATHFLFDTNVSEQKTTSQSLEAICNSFRFLYR